MNEQITVKERIQAVRDIVRLLRDSETRRAARYFFPWWVRASRHKGEIATFAETLVCARLTLAKRYHAELPAWLTGRSVSR